MPESLPPKLGNTSTDIMVSIAKGTVGAIPYVGSLIAEIVGNVIPNQRVDRIAEFVRLLEERLAKVEKENLRERFTEPAAIDIMEDSFTQAARATTRERLEHIANIVAHGLSAEELNQAEVKRMLWLLGQLHDAEIIILRGRLPMTNGDFAADGEFQRTHANLLTPIVLHTGSTEDDIEDAAIRGSYLQHLHDLGLLKYRFDRPKKDEIPEFDPETGRLKARGSQVTRLGRILLRYLNQVPEWYRW